MTGKRFYGLRPRKSLHSRLVLIGIPMRIQKLMQLIPAIVCLLIQPILLSGETPVASFETEQLTFCLSDSLLSFDGLFMFSNLSSNEVNPYIYFPIIADSLQLPFYHADVLDPDSGESVLANQNDDGIGFYLRMPPQTSQAIQIRYQQKLTAQKAKYILLTANEWKRALPYGEYKVILPRGTRILHYPFPEPQYQPEDGGDVYYWEFYDFSPQEDFYISWE